jgi:hypothetical protein
VISGFKKPAANQSSFNEQKGPQHCCQHLPPLSLPPWPLASGCREGHSAFLAGGLGSTLQMSLRNYPGRHAEPINALSISTWAFAGSVLEYLFAMNLVWDYS